MQQSSDHPRPVRSVSALLSALTLLATMLSTPHAAAQPSTPTRFDGADPVSTAVLVSQARFADATATSAILATTRDYADALAGAALHVQGPLLLTGPDSLSDATATELGRVLPAGSEVLVLGGAAAISETVLADVRALGYTTRRLEGPSRFETAVAIVEEAYRIADPGVRLLLARGDAPVDNPTAGWADAISGSTLGPPVLLTSSTSLHPATEAFLRGFANPDFPGELFLLGGESALSAAVEAAVPDGIDTFRFQGPARDGTAVHIATQANLGGELAVLYDGYATDGWAYGLSAATYARDNNAALLPVNSTAVATATRDFLCAADGREIRVVGATSVVSDATVAAHLDCDSEQPPGGGQQVVLSGSGLLPEAQLGGSGTAAIDALTAALGAPSSDGEQPCLSGDGRRRTVAWDGLSVHVVVDEDRFDYWVLGSDALGLETDRGIGFGSTNAEIRAAYPDGEYVQSISAWSLPPEPDLLATMSGSDDADVLIQMDAGSLSC